MVQVGGIYSSIEDRKNKIVDHKIEDAKFFAGINYLIITAFAGVGLYLAVFHNDDKIKTLGGGFAGSALGAVVQRMSKTDEIKPD